MNIKVRDIKELLSLYKDDEILEFENLTAIYAIVKQNILLNLTTQTPFPDKGNDFDSDTQETYSPVIPSNIPDTITINDIMEFLDIAKNIFSKNKRVSDGIPYGMLKSGVDFALDDKLFKYHIKYVNNADNARKAKLNTYKSILTANEDYWKNI